MKSSLFENKTKSWCLHIFSNKHYHSFQSSFCFPPQYTHTLTHPHSSCLFLLRLLLSKSTVIFDKSNMHYPLWGFLGLSATFNYSITPFSWNSFFSWSIWLLSLLAFIPSLTSYSFSVSTTRLIFLLYLMSKYWSVKNLMTYFSTVCPLVILCILMI